MLLVAPRTSRYAILADSTAGLNSSSRSGSDLSSGTLRVSRAMTQRSKALRLALVKEVRGGSSVECTWSPVRG